MASYVLGKDVVFKVEDTVLGCAKSMSFATEREMTDVTCGASGGFKQQVPGLESWVGSVTATLRVFTETEEATEVSLLKIYGFLRAGTEIDVDYTLGGVNGIRFTAKAYIQSVSVDVPDAGSGEVTWTAELVGNSPLLIAA